MRKKKKYKRPELKLPMKAARTLDQMHPGLNPRPSQEYFERKNVNDIPGYPKKDYFSNYWKGSSR